MSRLLFWSFDESAAPGPAASAYVRMLLALLPPGKLWRLVGESTLRKLFEGCADELGRVDARVNDLLDEADPRTAVEMLAEHETELDLVAAEAVAATIVTTTLEDPLAIDPDGVPLVDGASNPAGIWNAVLSWRAAGTVGNGKGFKIAGSDGFAANGIVEVRDNQSWNVSTEEWVSDLGVVGVIINNNDCTVAALEAAINATSALVAVTTPDVDNAADKADLGSSGRRNGTFGGGAEAVDVRRASIIARLIARQRYRPVDFQTALAPLLGQLAANVVVIERSRAFAVSINDDREIYRFFIYRNPALPNAYFLAAAQALVDAIKPTHTKGHVIESINFLCDDPFSLCNRDLLGI